MLGGNDLLAAISQLLFIPDDRLEKTLQRSRGDLLIQRDRFDVLALHVRQQTPHVNMQQAAPLGPRETAGEMLPEIGRAIYQVLRYP